MPLPVQAFLVKDDTIAVVETWYRGSLPNATLGLILFHYCDLANAFFGLFTSLLQFLGQK